MKFTKIFSLLRQFPDWLRSNDMNKLIFIRFVLLAINMLIFFGAVIWVILKLKGKI